MPKLKIQNGESCNNFFRNHKLQCKTNSCPDFFLDRSNAHYALSKSPIQTCLALMYRYSPYVGYADRVQPREKIWFVATASIPCLDRNRRNISARSSRPRCTAAEKKQFFTL